MANWNTLNYNITGCALQSSEPASTKLPTTLYLAGTVARIAVAAAPFCPGARSEPEPRSWKFWERYKARIPNAKLAP